MKPSPYVPPGHHAAVSRDALRRGWWASVRALFRRRVVVVDPGLRASSKVIAWQMVCTTRSWKRRLG